MMRGRLFQQRQRNESHRHDAQHSPQDRDHHAGAALPPWCPGAAARRAAGPGANVSGWDIALIAVVSLMGTTTAYVRNPEHKAFGKLLGPYLAKVTVLDYFVKP